MTTARIDLSEHARAASRHVETPWDDLRTELIQEGVKLRARRRTAMRIGLVGAVAAGAVAIGMARDRRDSAARSEPDVSVGVVARPDVTSSEDRVAEPGTSTGEAPEPLEGLTIEPRSEDTSTPVVHASASHVGVEVEAGAAVFDVAEIAGRAVDVFAGDVTVYTVAARFGVDRASGQTRVWVERGTIELRTGRRVHRMGAGDEHVVGSEDEAVRETAARRPEPQLEPSREPPRASDDAPAVAGDPVASLFERADLRRELGDFEGAATALRAIVRDHSGDPRASLAAFSLGKILVDPLGLPAPAARAFATARRLAPSGAIAADALAREAIAWDRAGQSERARQRAREYLQQHPQGNRRREMTRIEGDQ